MSDGLPGALDIGGNGARQTGDHRMFGAAGNFRNRFKIAIGGNRKPGFDDIDAHFIKLFCDHEFFLMGHRCAGRLFAIAQGGIKNQNLVLARRNVAMSGGAGPRCYHLVHGICLLSVNAKICACSGRVICLSW